MWEAKISEIVVPESVFPVRGMPVASVHSLDLCSENGLNSTLNPTVKGDIVLSKTIPNNN